MVASEEQRTELQHILDHQEADDRVRQSLGSLMAKYKAYKDKDMKSILFDPTNDHLSECLKLSEKS